MPLDVIAVGTLNMDLIIIGDAPRDMDKLLDWVDVSQVEFTAAGSMGYCAVDMARLGLGVSVISCVADDFFGGWILKRLGGEGIDTTGINVEKGQTSGLGIYILLFGSRKRPLTGKLSTHAPWPAELSPLQDQILRRGRLLHCGGYLHYQSMWGKPAESLFRRAKDLGLMTSLDTQFPMSPMPTPWIQYFGNLLEYVDIIFTDELEAGSITGAKGPEESAKALLDQGPRLAVVKLGAEGALLASRDSIVRQPAFPVSEFTDSIGAGDAFDAGAIYGVLAGWDLERIGRFAAMTAACTLKGIGGNQSAPTAEEVFARLKNAG